MIYEKILNTKHFQEDKICALYRSGDVLVFIIWSMFISYGITKVEILSCLSFSHDSSKQHEFKKKNFIVSNKGLRLQNKGVV